MRRPLQLAFCAVLALMPLCAADPGDAYCWGSNLLGQLGSDPNVQDAVEYAGTPIPVDTNLTFTSLSAETSFVCGVTTDATMACWGTHHPGAGKDSDWSYAAPFEFDFDGTFTKVSTGNSFACGLLSNGSIACVGDNSQGQLGVGDRWLKWATIPQLANSGGTLFIDVAAGAQHVCALSIEGRIYCWGSNQEKQLGQEQGTSIFSPLPVADTRKLGFMGVAVGDSHSCGLMTSGYMACWGSGSRGQLGALSFEGKRVGQSTTPLVVPGHTFKMLTARHDTTCGITVQGALMCTGVINSIADKEGFAEANTSAEMVRIRKAPKDITALSTGGVGRYEFHACGLDDDQGAFCWGLNKGGQLGSPQAGSRGSKRPVEVDTDLAFSAISAGGAFTCAVSAV